MEFNIHLVEMFVTVLDQVCVSGKLLDTNIYKYINYKKAISVYVYGVLIHIMTYKENHGEQNPMMRAYKELGALSQNSPSQPYTVHNKGSLHYD